ncbi:hypothetical protein ACN08N_27840 (plasmid) [Photobacterium leiognathi subsp. mandapamensis]|uniref:hypothetical protein n=1 Tax=Vibrionaceae TaxID=641 RepID=UPI000A716372|nr:MULTISPECIES: hypothetical protein [Vibrio]EID0160568.1 hypothetical protein [Vibrio cholerae]EJG1067245.1 hypothetical protein [Vibrio parahaemolyticus O1]MCR9514067.1 hypothetical protein [Vibrio alginolyticus]EHY1001235.1 hypothetical protein [Vibrio parahaemolyticus]EIE5872975.1 hypothetical protein [Vibrio parahaemolyticus]
MLAVVKLVDASPCINSFSIRQASVMSYSQWISFFLIIKFLKVFKEFLDLFSGL